MKNLYTFIIIIFVLILIFELHHSSKDIEPFKKLGKSIKKKADKAKDAIFNKIKSFIVAPINAIKNKKVKKWFKDNVNTKKDLGKVIMQITIAIAKAIFIILFLIPFLTFIIGTNIIPFMSFVSGLAISMFQFLFVKPM